MPDPIFTNSTKRPEREYASAAIVGKSILLVSDGYGLLYVLALVPTGTAVLLKAYHLEEPSSCSTSDLLRPFSIHGIGGIDHNSVTVILSAKNRSFALQDQPSSKSQRRATEYDVFCATIKWDVSVPETQTYSMDIMWHRTGWAPPLYVAHVPSLNAFLLVADGQYKRLDDTAAQPSGSTLNEGHHISREETSQGSSERPPPYAWTQDGE